MDDLSAFRETLAAVVAEGGSQAPRRICELCVVALPVDGAAITVMVDADRQSLVWASDPVAARIDELGFRLSDGPNAEAFVSGRPVLIADVADTGDARWPVFAAAVARETTARGLFVWPLRAGEVRIGVLDFYRDRPGLLDAAAVARAEEAADAAFWSLVERRPGSTLDARGVPVDAGADGDGLVAADGPGIDGALQRREVYQATGMLVAQLGVSPDAALARLRAHAFAHDRTVDEVAGEILARRLRLDLGPP